MLRKIFQKIFSPGIPQVLGRYIINKKTIGIKKWQSLHQIKEQLQQ